MSEARKSSPAWIAICWTIVVLPTLWGLSYTVQNAMKIFAKPSTTTTESTSTTAPAK